jgi:Recombination endonuclease VII
VIPYKVPSPGKLSEFGLTADQHRELWGDGRCIICRQPFTVDGARCAVIDHDHETYYTRGVIGSYCNYEIGVHHDNAEWFTRVGEYLTHPPTELWAPRPRIANAPPERLMK